MLRSVEKIDALIDRRADNALCADEIDVTAALVHTAASKSACPDAEFGDHNSCLTNFAHFFEPFYTFGDIILFDTDYYIIKQDVHDITKSH